MFADRFGRFTKEYGIVGPANAPQTKGGQRVGTLLVSGEADIVFKNCIKINAPTVDLGPQSPTHAGKGSSKGRPFVVPKGQKTIIGKPGAPGLPLVAKYASCVFF